MYGILLYLALSPGPFQVFNASAWNIEKVGMGLGMRLTLLVSPIHNIRKDEKLMVWYLAYQLPPLYTPTCTKCWDSCKSLQVAPPEGEGCGQLWLPVHGERFPQVPQDNGPVFIASKGKRGLLWTEATAGGARLTRKHPVEWGEERKTNETVSCKQLISPLTRLLVFTLQKLPNTHMHDVQCIWLYSSF